MTDLNERLRQVESSDGKGAATTNWYRNPDGPEAADRIALLEGALRDVLAFRRGQGKYSLSGLSDYDRGNAAEDAWQEIETRLQALAETEVGGE